MAAKKCPVCGTSVKLENFERHVRNQHPRADVDVSTALTATERKAVERAGRPARPAVSRRGLLFVIVILIVVVSLILVAVWNPFQGGSLEHASDFSLPKSTGGTLTLSTLLLTTPVLVEFMDVDCEFCQQEAPVLASVYQAYSTKVKFVSVDVNFVGSADDFSRMNAFKTQYGTPWDYVLDQNGQTGQAYRVTGTPTTFVVDRHDAIVKRIDGVAPGGYAEIAAALDQALQR